MVTEGLETTVVFGRNGVTGVRAASHVIKVYNFGIEHVFLLLDALMVLVWKRRVAIFKNAQASIDIMPLKIMVISSETS